MKPVVKLGLGPLRASLALPAPANKAIVPMQRLSPTQMKKIRDKGLCYNCDKKWALRHKYNVAKLFIMECDNSGDDEETNCNPIILEEGGPSSENHKNYESVGPCPWSEDYYSY